MMCVNFFISFKLTEETLNCVLCKVIQTILAYLVFHFLLNITQKNCRTIDSHLSEGALDPQNFTVPGLLPMVWKFLDPPLHRALVNTCIINFHETNLKKKNHYHRTLQDL